MTTPSRPGAITAVAICAMVLGILGLLGACGGVATLLVQGPLLEQQADLIEQTAPPGQAEAQLELQRRSLEIQQAWMPFTITHQTFNFLASAALLFASIMLVQMKAIGSRVFMIAAVANAIVDIAGTAIGVAIQQQSMALMSTAMSDIAGDMPDPSLGETMEVVTTASAWVGVCFAGLFLLIKLGFYSAGVLTLSKPANRDALAAASAQS